MGSRSCRSRRSLACSIERDLPTSLPPHRQPTVTSAAARQLLPASQRNGWMELQWRHQRQQQPPAAGRPAWPRVQPHQQQQQQMLEQWGRQPKSCSSFRPFLTAAAGTAACCSSRRWCCWASSGQWPRCACRGHASRVLALGASGCLTCCRTDANMHVSTAVAAPLCSDTGQSLARIWTERRSCR